MTPLLTEKNVAQEDSKNDHAHGAMITITVLFMDDNCENFVLRGWRERRGLRAVVVRHPLERLVSVYR